jgi:hypothetical protein
VHRFGFLALLLVFGCSKNEPIRVYDAAHEDYSDAGLPRTYRILGAIVPADGENKWFFKVAGPNADLAKYEAEIRKFYASIVPNADAKAMPRWTLPAGWRLAGKTQMAQETIAFGPEAEPFTITITKSGGSLTDNLYRWANRQLGMRWRAELMSECCTPFGDPQVGLIVDLAGPKNPSMQGMMPPPPAVSIGPKRIVGAYYPADGVRLWVFKVSGSDADIQAHLTAIDKLFTSVKFPQGPGEMPSFDLADGARRGGADPAKMAEETVLFGNLTMTIGKFGGSQESNLERWAGQLQLPWPPENLAKYIKPIPGHPSAIRIDMTAEK